MTLDEMIARLQELREAHGGDCTINIPIDSTWAGQEVESIEFAEWDNHYGDHFRHIDITPVL